MVVFDASVLIDLFNEKLKGDRRARLDELIQNLAKTRTKILIPAPALAEFLARAGKARDRYFQSFSQSSQFKVAPFGNRAAMECALLLDNALTGGDKRNNTKTWAKAKFDWQIVAIAKCESATTIFSEDDDLARIAQRIKLKTIKIDELPLPDSARQGMLGLDPIVE